MGISEISTFQPYSQSHKLSPHGTQVQGADGSKDATAALNSAKGPIDVANLQKGIDSINHMLSSQQTKVVLAKDTPPHQIWLDIVNATTGQVIERLPPEGLRQFMETQNAKGMAMDMRL